MAFQILGSIIGLIIGSLLVWFVILPALNYRDIGFWFIAGIRENPPKGYRYRGQYARPLWKKVIKGDD